MFKQARHMTGFMLVAVAGLLNSGGTARADVHDHVDGLAVRLQREVQAVHREVDAHFRGSPQYRHLHRDVSELGRLASHLHDVAHRRGNVYHLRADVRRLDQLVHHAEELVDDMARGGRLGGTTLDHLRRSLHQVSDTVHHMVEHLE